MDVLNSTIPFWTNDQPNDDEAPHIGWTLHSCWTTLHAHQYPSLDHTPEIMLMWSTRNLVINFSLYTQAQHNAGFQIICHCRLCLLKTNSYLNSSEWTKFGFWPMDPTRVLGLYILYILYYILKYFTIQIILQPYMAI